MTLTGVLSGNYQETRGDTTVAVQLVPNLIEAIEYGEFNDDVSRWKQNKILEEYIDSGLRFAPQMINKAETGKCLS